MQTQALLQWVPVAWPTPGVNASEYAIFLGSATTPLATTNTNSYMATYDDATSVVYAIRPTDGSGNYGPQQTLVFSNVPLNNRAWIRSVVRKAYNDRIDNTAATTLTVTDDEINDYINDAIRAYSLQFPKDNDVTIQLVDGQRDYALPPDFQRATQVAYHGLNGREIFYIKEEPLKGGETTATSWIGFSKLGFAVPAVGGRLYNGHFEVHAGRIYLDFDPAMASDYLDIRYAGQWTFPADDFTALDIPSSDMDLILTYVQYKVWLEIESKDVKLSRWRGKEDGSSRRDDLPTEKMSARMLRNWDALVASRRSLRPRMLRLVRRT